MTIPSCPSHVLEPAILPGGRCIYGCRACGAVEDKSPDRRRFEADMEERARAYLREAYAMGYTTKPSQLALDLPIKQQTRTVGLVRGCPSCRRIRRRWLVGRDGRVRSPCAECLSVQGRKYASNLKPRVAA